MSFDLWIELWDHFLRYLVNIFFMLFLMLKFVLQSIFLRQTWCEKLLKDKDSFYDIEFMIQVKRMKLQRALRSVIVLFSYFASSQRFMTNIIFVLRCSNNHNIMKIIAHFKKSHRTTFFINNKLLLFITSFQNSYLIKKNV